MTPYSLFWVKPIDWPIGKANSLLITVVSASLKPLGSRSCRDKGLYSNNRSKFHWKFFFGAFYFSNTSPYGSKTTLQHCGSMKFYVHVFLLPFMLKQRKKPHTNHSYIQPFGNYHYTKQQVISSWLSRVDNSFIQRFLFKQAWNHHTAS